MNFATYSQTCLIHAIFIPSLTTNNMPQKFRWDDDYSVGIEKIDQQHRHFFEIANQLLDMISKESIHKEEFESIILELERYAFYHLETEEQYFAEYKFPDAPIHIAAHDQYRETVRNLVERSRDPQAHIKTLAEECAMFSAKWLIKHIQVMDKQFAPFFLEKGIK